MADDLSSLQTRATSEINAVTDEASLEALRIQFLGKKGELTAMAAGMRDLSPAERPAFGKLLNEARDAITAALATKKEALTAAADAKAAEGLDVTLPGRPMAAGALHPLTQVLADAVSILRRMGFSLAEGPEIETEWACFDALNTPADHPARNEKDTFYFPDGKLLRTQTSTVQIREMLAAKALPLRIISPGSAYRRDAIDATHLSVFTQMEGLFVAEDVSLADLKGTLNHFFQEFFGHETELRFRPHFFPFTEPSYEVDVRLRAAGKEPKWLEVMGCGMVDPAVFQNVSDARGDKLFDPMQVRGFAFGGGLERLAMIRHQIYNIRALIDNDVRFLRQFA